MKPLLLVDVDGVLLPFGDDPPLGYLSGPDVRGGTCFFAAVDNQRRLGVLSEVFEPVWCTARYDDVAETIARWHGIGEDWPTIQFEGAVVINGPIVSIKGLGTKTWKLPFVEAWLEQTGNARRPLVWIDDDLYHPDVQRWAEERAVATGLVPISPLTGLSDDYVTVLMQMADMCATFPLSGMEQPGSSSGS